MEEKAFSNRQIKAAETKNRIYKSAEHLFNKNGFDDISIDDIVKLVVVVAEPIAGKVEVGQGGRRSRRRV